MKVLDLHCANGHGFEGWFGSEDEFLDQNGRHAIECPLCADRVVTRLPSAPRLNLSGAREPAAAEATPTTSATAAPATATLAAKPALPEAADLQAAWLHAVRHLVENTEDVGPQFAEEARRMHYGEKSRRGIRGQATPDEREALREEGIEVMSLPLPRALEGPLQ